MQEAGAGGKGRSRKMGPYCRETGAAGTIRKPPGTAAGRNPGGVGQGSKRGAKKLFRGSSGEGGAANVETLTG